MSYARFGWENSDVYVYQHVHGYIECCGCSLIDPENDDIFGFAKLNTAREALDHLSKHLAIGEIVPLSAFGEIKKDHPDLDAQIEEWKPKDHPPKQFRDKGNGE